MKIIKEGEVIFRNGKIVEINNFNVDCNEKTEAPYINTLQEYVEKNYIFKGKK